MANSKSAHSARFLCQIACPRIVSYSPDEHQLGVQRERERGGTIRKLTLNFTVTVTQWVWIFGRPRFDHKFFRYFVHINLSWAPEAHVLSQNFCPIIHDLNRNFNIVSNLKEKNAPY